MKILGTILARLGSKRLPYKNILPFQGQPLMGVGINTLRQIKRINDVIVSTESELIARIAHFDYSAHVLQRPHFLAEDGVPSIPVFQHIMEHFEADLYVNYNFNFPLCRFEAIEEAIILAEKYGEVLSNPVAVWVQTRECLLNYGDPYDIKAHRFDIDCAGPVDIHREEDLLQTYQYLQGPLIGWRSEICQSVEGVSTA